MTGTSIGRRARPTSTTVARGVLGVAGVVLVAVGVQHVLTLSVSDLVALACWLAGGVVVHDVVLAPLLALVGFAGPRVLPPWLRAPLAAGLVVLGAVTLMAVPVLGRFGAKPDDPGLLDRPYGLLWLLFVMLVGLGVLVGALASRRRTTGGS